MQENELTKDVHIDRSNLHMEWVRHSELYAKWAMRHVKALHAQEKMKIQMDILYGTLDAKVRKHWDTFGFEKPPTEAAVTGWVKTQPEYKELQEKLADNTYFINMFNAARQALEHKKRALEDLVRLYTAGYYGQLPTSDGPPPPDLQSRNLA